MAEFAFCPQALDKCIYFEMDATAVDAAEPDLVVWIVSRESQISDSAVWERLGSVCTPEKLLDLSRRDDGVQPDVTIVDLQQAVHGTLHLLRPLADRSSVTITCLMSEGVTVRASEDDIYNIVFNLVENAIKYNLPGGKVFVSVCRDGDKVLLEVADPGIGIPEEELTKEINRF